ncbi:MAG: transposase [Moorea sp. SIO3I6]|nr:transposase [Moorena sp. SIO3I6]
MSRLPQISNHHRQPYPSDMSDVESEVLRPLIPKPKGFGPLRRVNLREMINGICYVQRSGSQLNMLHHDFLPHPRVYGYFRKWQPLWVWAENPWPIASSTPITNGR